MASVERMLKIMNFGSILYDNQKEVSNTEHKEIPFFFTDLNLDQVINTITFNWEYYNLKPFFYSIPNDENLIFYRQQVFKDLENELLYNKIILFTKNMSEVRRILSIKDTLHYHHQKEIWFLYAVVTYCNTIKQLADDLSSFSFFQSQGIKEFTLYLNEYIKSEGFTTLYKNANTINNELLKVKYQVIIRNNSFTVQNYHEETDYSIEILETFNKFKQGYVGEYIFKYQSYDEYMNPIEAKILEYVAQLNKELFNCLDNFMRDNLNFINDTILTFDREIHFYISYLLFIEKFKKNNLQFCYPSISNSSKEIFNTNGFDLALANKLISENLQIVCNDFFLTGKERILIVTGPNQGGKTTFARTFGQLHYFTNIGCPVPGSNARLFKFDNLFTLFERSEKVEDMKGKLEDDLIRMDSIIKQATSSSIIIINEIFNSTTLQDMTILSKSIISKLINKDLFCVWVTFVDELASFSEETVSMTSMIVPDNPTARTYKIVRNEANGLAYANAIVEKYNLTYEKISKRLEL